MTTMTQLTVGATAKETTANENFKSLSGFAAFGRKSTTSGTTWAYYGGRMMVDGVLTAVSDGTLALATSTTNYIEVSRAGAVSSNNTGFTAGRIPLYQVVTNTTSITSETDVRSPFLFIGRASLAVTTADVTLTQAQAACELLEFTDTLTGNRSVIVPTQAGWYMVYNNTDGAFALTVKTSAGTGIVVGQKRYAILICDGTDVVRAQTDALGQDIAYGASITPDAALGDVVVGTLTGNITINAPTNPTKHQRLAFLFTQDGTGGWAITWNAAFKKAADGAGTASQKGVTAFQYDGTNWIQVGGALAWFT